jgi:phosphoribosylanthranilate isomerase
LTIHLIAIEKTIKAVILIVVGFKLLTLVGQDVHAWASDFVARHGIDIGNRYVQAALERLVGISSGQIAFWSMVALVYSAVLLVEASGLWLQKRWAEYLTVVSTALLVPLELYEIYERFTWVRIAILAINIFIVWYLATRLRDEKKETIGDVDGRNHNSEVKVKICGITNLEDAKQALDAGADELGFNFYPKSPRYVSPEAARKIVDSLPIAARMVGVFVNEPIETLIEIAQFVGLDGIQLHGDEDNVYVKELSKRTKLFVIKVFRVSPNIEIADCSDWNAEYQLFDTYSAAGRGGTGQAFDWEAFGADVHLWVPYSAYLAGGLTPENVAEAVRKVCPYAVDVASGVESSPGKKDHQKVAAFVRAAKEAYEF